MILRTVYKIYVCLPLSSSIVVSCILNKKLMIYDYKTLALPIYIIAFVIILWCNIINLKTNEYVLLIFRQNIDMVHIYTLLCFAHVFFDKKRQENKVKL